VNLVSVPIDALRPAEYNPRRMPREKLESLKRSIERFGFVEPVVVNRRRGRLWEKDERGDVIVGGHQRVRAERELGHARVPVVFVDLDPEGEQTLNLALNSGGEWDLEKLGALLKSLRQAGADLAASGFSDTEIERAIRDAERALAIPVDEDEVPPAPRKARTKPGELVRLGSHRLLCGDSRDPAALRRLLEGDLADCVWTDPPYGVDYSGKTRESLKIQGDLQEGLEELLDKAFAAVNRVLRPGGAIYVAHPGGDRSLVFLQTFLRVGWKLRQTLAWVKDSMVLGRSHYQLKHEQILYGHRPGPAGWYGGRDQTSVFEVPRPKSSREHPTMKPVALIEACLRNSSRQDEAVLDPFGGSGSTLIACHRLGRRAYLMEVDPRYCDVIRNRWRRFTGQREG